MDAVICELRAVIETLRGDASEREKKFASLADLVGFFSAMSISFPSFSDLPTELPQRVESRHSLKSPE